MDYDWLNLPEHLWITILQQLDLKSLLNISETCSTLNNLLCDPIFSKKLKLSIEYDSLLHKHFVNIFKHSNRKYRSVKYSNFRYLVYPTDPTDQTADFEVMLEILNRFSDSMREIRIIGIEISSSNWNRLIQSLKYVETFELSNVAVHKSPTGIEKSALKIDSLSMDCCNLRFLDKFDGSSVRKVKLIGEDISNYIPFLMNHEELKSLTASISSFYINDKLSNLKFSLEHLDLISSNWYINQHALNFIRTQTELQTVIIDLTMNQYEILFLKHIINHNPKLKTLFIILNGRCGIPFDIDVDQIETNLSVTRFYFHCYPENIELTEKIYRLFPNNIHKKVDDYYKIYNMMKNLNIEYF